MRESEFEKIASSALLAEDEQAREVQLLRRLERELEQRGTEMKVSQYSSLKTRIDQQRQRAELASRRAAERKQALDDYRSNETSQRQREEAQRRYELQLAAFQQAESDLATHRAELQRLSRELPIVERQFNQCLAELDRARQALPTT